MNRRDFLSLMAAAPVLGQAAFAAAQDRPLRHAVVGCGGQGRRHARVFANTRDCQLVAFAELDPARREQTLKELGDKAEGVTAYEDFRELLQNPEIDSVSVATPDHWHTPVALLALQAGKHVYVEKPCCHVPLEGQRLVDAAKASGKCVQHGTQSRSGEGIKKAIGMLRDGAIGKVRLAKAINHQLREPIGRAPESDPPPGVNYDLWLGPAPKHAFTQNRWHYNWHWFWDYGGGDFVNDGVHQVDVARWGLGVAYPKLVTGSGGQLFYDDDHQTPDTQLITFEYPDVYLVYEMRLWTEYPMEGITNGVIFYGDNGIMTIEGEGCYLLLKGQKRERIGDGHDFEANLQNFVDACRANDPSMLNAPIEEGAISANLCHLGNIVTRTKSRMELAEGELRVVGNDAAQGLMDKEYREGYRV